MVKRSFFWLLGVYVCVLFLGAELAVAVYLGIQYLNSCLDIQWVQYLARKPICQYVDRFRVVGFFLLLPYICKKSGIARESLCLRFNLKKYLTTFCCGCCLWCVLFLVCISIVGGVHAHKTTQTSMLVSIFFASLLLAVLEEIIFRGVIFAFFLKRYSETVSMFLLAFMFACLHFSMCDPGSAHNVFWHAVQCAYQSLTAIFVHVRWPYFTCLFLLSCILVQLRLKWNSLWCSIGFHQGLVFVLMLLRKKYAFTHYENSFWGDGHVTDAWFSVIVLVGIFITLSYYRRIHEKIS